MPKQSKKAIAQRMKNARLATGLSQRDAAEVARVTRQEVSKWESARRDIDAYQCGELAKLYGTSTDTIILGMEAVPVRERSACEGCKNFAGLRRVSALTQAL
jgi:transcriptional regulator with XRE-family HTH domain